MSPEIIIIDVYRMINNNKFDRLTQKSQILNNFQLDMTQLTSSMSNDDEK